MADEGDEGITRSGPSVFMKKGARDTVDARANMEDHQAIVKLEQDMRALTIKGIVAIAILLLLNIAAIVIGVLGLTKK